MTMSIRAAVSDDADAISRVIIAALRETNAKDYPQDIIDRLEHGFRSEAVRELMETRTVFVAMREARIVGTASLDGAVIRTVFVSPDAQGQGVGRRLMARAVVAAREAGITNLVVPSSVTAEQFYAKLGFKAVRDVYHGKERTIVMVLDIDAP